MTTSGIKPIERPMVVAPVNHELECFVLGFALGYLVTKVATSLGFGRRATKKGHPK